MYGSACGTRVGLGAVFSNEESPRSIVHEWHLATYTVGTIQWYYSKDIPANSAEVRKISSPFTPVPIG